MEEVLKILRKSLQIIAILSLILGITPKAEAINWFNIGVSAAVVTYLYTVLSRQNSDQNNAQPSIQETIRPTNQPRQEITSISNRQTLADLENYAPRVIYEKLIDGTNLEIIVQATNENSYATEYKVYINQLNSRWNFAKFTVFKKDGQGYLDVLHVGKENRKKNYGALLFACAIKEMMDLGCNIIKWLAEPNDLLPSQTIEETLPKLIKFYQQLGAQPSKIERRRALMQLTDLKKAREGIYKILEQWESKNSFEVNNNKELQRVVTIVNHIAPK